MDGLKNDMNRLCDLVKALHGYVDMLHEKYGITMDCRISTTIYKSCDHTTVQLMNGIEEVAQAVKRKPKETNEWQLRKDFKYYGVAFCQLAERNSRKYKGLKCKEVGKDGTIREGGKGAANGC